jgi:hypothetical protein
VVRHTLGVFVLVLGIAVATPGQTSADLGAKYRQITSYKVRPDTVMTPRYAQGGQARENGQGHYFRVVFRGKGVERRRGRIGPAKRTGEGCDGAA